MNNFVHFSWKICLILALLSGNACHTYYSNVSVNGALSVLDSTIVDDSSALLIIEPYKSSIDLEMNEIISYSDIAITKNQPEGLLNNFVSDLVLYMCNKYHNDSDDQYDVSVLNNGGLRASLPQGLITVGDVYRLMPFENETVVLTLTGSNFLEMVNYIIVNGGVPFSGMRITSKQLALESLSINNHPFDKNKQYTVVTSDYLALGGDKMTFFNNPVEILHLKVLIRDLIIDYLKEMNHLGVSVHPKLDGRIVYE